MTAGRIPDAAAVPLLEGEATFTIIGRANAAVTAGTWHLVFIGVVGTATVILFSLASWPLLGTGKAPITGSYVSMVVSNEADGQLPAGPRSTYSPAPEAEKISDAFSPQPTPVSAVSAAGRAKSDLELARQDHDADTGPATAGILMQGVRITNPQSIEQLGSTATAVAERPSIAEGIGTVPDVSLRTVPSEIPDGEGREVSHSVEMQKEPANLYHDNLPPEQNGSTQNRHNQPLHHRLLSSNTALNSRVQKECGSIIFPALRRHCVASFGIHHR